MPDYAEVFPGAGKAIFHAPSCHYTILDHQLKLNEVPFYPFSYQMDVVIME